MVLYEFPISQHSRRVVSLLMNAEIRCERKLVDLTRDEHLEKAYLAINPNHQVPTLVDGDLVIHESNAILRYLCDKYELTHWYPKDFKLRARVDQWLDWIQCQQSPAIVAIVLNSVFAGEKGDLLEIDKGYAQLNSTNAILERALTDQAYLCGNQPTIADLALVSNLCHLGFVDAIPTTPAISAWFEKMLTLKGVIESLPEPLLAVAA